MAPYGPSALGASDEEPNRVSQLPVGQTLNVGVRTLSRSLGSVLPLRQENREHPSQCIGGAHEALLS